MVCDVSEKRLIPHGREAKENEMRFWINVANAIATSVPSPLLYIMQLKIDCLKLVTSNYRLRSKPVIFRRYIFIVLHG